MIKKVFSVVVCCLMVLLCGCNSAGQNQRTIAVSIVPQATFVKAVAGDLWDVVTLIPPGSSPENHELTMSERMAFEDAQVYFSVGVPAEEAMLSVVSENTRIVALQDTVSSKYDDILIDGGRDPHIWLSPKRAKVMVETIALELSEIDPRNADIYRKNADDYMAKLDELDAYISDKLSGISNRKFIVFHPAFAYIAADYSLEMYALQDEGDEATLTHLGEMADLARKEGIKAVFYQAEIDSKQAEAFAQQIGGKTVMLEPLAADYIENLKGMADLLAETMR